MSFHIKEFQPSKALRPYVELFWEGYFNTVNEHLLRKQVAPNGFMELIIHPTEFHCFLPNGNQWLSSPDYTLIGLYTQPYEVRFRDYVQVFGIRFKPESLYNLFGVPASEFQTGYEDMELVLGTDFREYCTRLVDVGDTQKRIGLMEEFLLKSLHKNKPEVTYVNLAAEIIRQSGNFSKIEELPGKVYISLRQLERGFQQKIGMSPKRYMRIARLNEVHRNLEKGKEMELSSVAFDCGYADQAHFIRDFKNFMGVNPTIFIKERNQFIINA